MVSSVGLVHEVDSGSNIAAGLELQAQGVAGCFDAVGTRVVGTVESAVLGTCGSVGAKGLVPGVAGVAVGVAVCFLVVKPGIDQQQLELPVSRTYQRQLASIVISPFTLEQLVPPFPVHFCQVSLGWVSLC